MTTEKPRRKIFTLADAERLLPTVQERTSDAVHQAHHLSAELDQLSESDPRRAGILDTLDQIVAEWARDMRALSLEVKGLWLVDFDNGEGYYCWKHPEPSVHHYHGYDDGFAGRMKIV